MEIEAAGALSDITINNPTSEGILVSGSTGATMDSITVNDGRYGVRMGSNAGGKLALTNMDLDNQSMDGIVLSKTMNLDLSGTIANAGYCAVKVLSSNSGDWEFDGLNLNNNGVGVTHDGSGTVFMSDTTMSGNTQDVTMSGTATMEYLEGDIDDTKVSISDSAKFTRQRSLDVSISADSTAVDGARVKVLDANNAVIDSGTTDSSGGIDGMKFVAWTKDASGKTVANLAGYQLVSLAHIDYVNGNSIDIRYAMDTITLADQSGNTASATLTSSITDRVCYSYTANDVMGRCTGMNYRSQRTVDGVVEHGYYIDNNDMTNKVIQMDSPYNYADIGTGTMSFNNSIIFTTGTWNSESRIYVTYPYQGNDLHAQYDRHRMGDESKRPKQLPNRILWNIQLRAV